MQKALCNATADGKEHTHICNSPLGHKGQVHICRCGAIFASVKKSVLDRTGDKLEKVQ